MLKLENYIPIDIDKIKQVYKNEYKSKLEHNEGLIDALILINNESTPHAKREHALNHLPFCIIAYMNRINNERNNSEVTEINFGNVDISKHHIHVA